MWERQGRFQSPGDGLGRRMSNDFVYKYDS
jgi:hypothetical protein